MRLLLICPHFRPDLYAATGEVMTQLVESLADLDHEIDVVTSLPWYHRHDVEPEWRGRPWRTETAEWGRIVRAWPFPTTKTNVPARAAGFLAQTALVSGLAATLGRHDVVMGMSPPIFFGDAAWLVAKRSRAPFVFNAQDIFPDVAVRLGALTNPRVIEPARRHERSVYRRADAVTVLSEDQADNVRAKLAAVEPTAGADAGPDKVHIIPNCIDVDRITPVGRDNWYRRRHGLEGKTLVMYSGNVGLSQSFDLIRAGAEAWAADDRVHFVINGEGAARDQVESWVGGFDNVSIVDFGRRDEIPDILGAADLHLILLKSGLAASSTPSKLYGILASGRAILASIDVGSEVDVVVRRSGAGLSVAPDDPWAFVQALEKLLADPEELRSMGRRAREYAETCLTPAAQAQAYDKLFRDLVRAPGRQPHAGT